MPKRRDPFAIRRFDEQVLSVDRFGAFAVAMTTQRIIIRLIPILTEAFDNEATSSNSIPVASFCFASDGLSIASVSESRTTS